MDAIAAFAKDQLRLLTFRRLSDGARRHFQVYLTLSLAITVLAGVGRYWDKPDAQWWQYLGLGSFAYVFALAAIVWTVVKPLRPERWTYAAVLLFITMTSAPGFIYAIPVERCMSVQNARSVNYAFLAFVAAWRVALFAVFLLRFAKLPPFVAATALLASLCSVAVPIAYFGFAYLVTQGMAGAVGEDVRLAEIIVTASLVLLALAPFVAAAYVVMIIRRRRSARAS